MSSVDHGGLLPHTNFQAHRGMHPYPCLSSALERGSGGGAPGQGDQKRKALFPVEEAGGLRELSVYCQYLDPEVWGRALEMEKKPAEDYLL